MTAVAFLPSLSFSLNIHPDSMSLHISPMTAMHSAIDTVCLKNGASTAITIDSIHIFFLNGDTARDFRMGSDCHPGQFLEYNYNGWVYGTTHTTLRYVRDSLFLLQDSAGNATSISINPNDSEFFYVHVITNCPICGRMPSFPNTSKYRYSFHISGDAGFNLIVFINDAGTTSNRTPMAYSCKQTEQNPFNANLDLKIIMQRNGFNSMKAFDVLGHKVGTVAQGEINAGTYRVNWNAKRIANGIYYYLFTSGPYAKTRKMMLVK